MLVIGEQREDVALRDALQSAQTGGSTGISTMSVMSPGSEMVAERISQKVSNWNGVGAE